MNYQEVIRNIKSQANAKNVAGMARFGINSTNTLGVSMPYLRKIGKQIGRDHILALKLWQSKINEARILASLIDDPSLVSAKQMEDWVKDFDSWDVCDQVCLNLFSKTKFTWSKAVAWTKSDKEFVKRAGFALMAVLAVHDKEVEDKEFMKLLPIIKREAKDERNFVKKAVNWALRQIGKRNSNLRKQTIKTAEEIHKIESKSAKWIASDALRELKK